MPPQRTETSFVEETRSKIKEIAKQVVDEETNALNKETNFDFDYYDHEDTFVAEGELDKTLPSQKELSQEELRKKFEEDEDMEQNVITDEDIEF